MLWVRNSGSVFPEDRSAKEPQERPREPRDPPNISQFALVASFVSLYVPLLLFSRQLSRTGFLNGLVGIREA